MSARIAGAHWKYGKLSFGSRICAPRCPIDSSLNDDSSLACIAQRSCRFAGFPGAVFRLAIPLCVVIPLWPHSHVLASMTRRIWRRARLVSRLTTKDCLAHPEYEALGGGNSGLSTRRANQAFRTSGDWRRSMPTEAYAHLELKLGPDVAPGEGVTVGVLDTGIDGEASPRSATRLSSNALLSGRDRRGRKQVFSRHGGGEHHRRRGPSPIIDLRRAGRGLGRRSRRLRNSARHGA